MLFSLGQSLHSSLPSEPGVYLFKDADGKILYVGKAKDLKKRVSSYFSNKALDSKTLALVGNVKSVDHIRVGSEIEAFLLEAVLIKMHLPFYNIKLADDKTYPYVKIDSGVNPAVVIIRKREVETHGTKSTAQYFGPYTDVTALKTVLKLLRRIFPYQSVVNHPKRKCLYYHLGMCPCLPAVPENKELYLKNLKRIQIFLEGKKEEVIKTLLKEQATEVKVEEFEKAAEIQKKIDRITLITSSQYEPFRYLEKPDFYYERVEKEITSLETILKEYYPKIGKLDRIECYDISNLQGTNATGSMVVFVQGHASTKNYRRFKIVTKSTPDDFFMMQEVLGRRLKRKDWPFPNLLVIDGGKGHVGAALKALANAHMRIPVIGLAKREETIVVPQKKAGGVYFIEVKLDNSTPGINLLRRIRDEAHRFAITYHKLLRKKNMMA